MSGISSSDLRILISADSYADAAAAFHIVRYLVDSTGVEIGGLLVEGETAELCQIPNQRVVQARGTTTLAPSSAQVRTLMRADARAFQQSLSATAHQSSAPQFFAQERGNLVHRTLQIATSWDLLIVGYRQVHKMRGKIVVLGDPSPGQGPMDATAVRLCEQLHAERIHFIVQERPLTEPSGVIRFDTLNEALNRLSRLNTEAVLLDLRHGPVRSQTDVERVLEAARCPVIVFGTATKQPLLGHSIQVPSVSSA